MLIPQRSSFQMRERLCGLPARLEGAVIWVRECPAWRRTHRLRVYLISAKTCFHNQMSREINMASSKKKVLRETSGMFNVAQHSFLSWPC